MEPTPIPAVEPEALRRFWAALQDCQQRFPSGEGQGIGFASEVISRMSGSTEPRAVMFRTVLLQALDRQGRLEGWLVDGIPSDAVFDLAGKWPINRIEEFDFQGFVEALRQGNF